MNFDFILLGLSVLLVYAAALLLPTLPDSIVFLLTAIGLLCFLIWVIVKFFVKPMRLGKVISIGLGVIFLGAMGMGFIAEAQQYSEGLSIIAGFILFIVSGAVFLAISLLLWGIRKLIKKDNNLEKVN